MKNIILQHWEGPVNELTKLSVSNISSYASSLGAEHKLITGPAFYKGLTSPCQKLVMLDPKFDEYDTVVIMDPDMFVRKNIDKDIFHDETGVGRHYGIQETLVKNLARKFPLLGDPNYAYWGGSIYRLERNIRVKLREQIRYNEVVQFSGNYEDEGIMHRLAVLAGIKNHSANYLTRDMWNKSSFEEDVEDSYIVHIRTKIKQGGPKQPKIENYKALVERGLI